MKNRNGEICRSGHYLDHIGCHEAATPDTLWMRKHRFERYFDHVDHFICPSHFLRDRYIEWGLSPDKLVVIENGRRFAPRVDHIASEEARTNGAPLRFGFFGQINPHKGLDVVLRGLGSLSVEERRLLRLDINGANLDRQPRAFRRMLSALAAPLIAEGVVRWRGPYTREQQAHRMADIDCVIVPSTWFENSPLVIQEAFQYGKPVLASQIGALPEKVQPGRGGQVVEAGNDRAWAGSMVGFANRRGELDQLSAKLPRPRAVSQTASVCLALVEGAER
jgi:glycosyltransferase involved in cell wall biosynthesis